MTALLHPTDFYIAHRVYSGLAFPQGPVWGGLTDGPADRIEMIDLINDRFDDEEPTLANVRVWHFQDDVPARDVTEDILTEAQVWRDAV